MGSRIIEIRRRANTTNLPDNIYEEAKQEIGPAFTKTGKTASGLSLDEVKLYMPMILSVPDTDVNFYREVDRYFANLSFDVPKTAIQLEIGMDKKNMPLNVEQFVKYRFSLANPLVAGHGTKPNRSHRFVIVDIAAAKDAQYAVLKTEKEAYKEFIKLTGDAERMNMVLRVFGVNAAKLGNEEKELRLEKILKSDAKGFLDIATNADLEIISMINECISKEVLRKVGNAIFNGDENIGNNMEDAILYLKDKQNSGTYAMLKARLESF
ncbi:MAG: hypothetical protein KI786_19835 [Mameliella sp.]|nr:hypothetical protein [Phaeodactylibacter sp.]